PAQHTVEGALDIADDHLEIVVETLAGFGRGDGAGTARQQSHPQRLLQCLDVLAGHGFADAEKGRRLGEGAEICHRQKRLHPVELGVEGRARHCSLPSNRVSRVASSTGTVHGTYAARRKGVAMTYRYRVATVFLMGFFIDCINLFMPIVALP